jgi:hypothetical protein
MKWAFPNSFSIALAASVLLAMAGQASAHPSRSRDRQVEEGRHTGYAPKLSGERAARASHLDARASRGRDHAGGRPAWCEMRV